MQVNDKNIIESRLMQSTVFEGSNYFAGVYILTLKARYVKNRLSVDETRYELEEIFPVLTDRNYHLMIDDELIIVHDRDDINLKMSLVKNTPVFNKGETLSFVSPSSGSRDPLIGFDTTDATQYEPTYRDKNTSVRIVKGASNIRYGVWLLHVNPAMGMHTLVVDSKVVINFTKPRIIPEHDGEGDDLIMDEE